MKKVRKKYEKNIVLSNCTVPGKIYRTVISNGTFSPQNFVPYRTVLPALVECDGCDVVWIMCWKLDVLDEVFGYVVLNVMCPCFQAR